MPCRRRSGRHEAGPSRPLAARRDGHRRRADQERRCPEPRGSGLRPHRPGRPAPVQRPRNGGRVRGRPDPCPHPRGHGDRQGRRQAPRRRQHCGESRVRENEVEHRDLDAACHDEGRRENRRPVLRRHRQRAARNRRRSSPHHPCQGAKDRDFVPDGTRDGSRWERSDDALPASPDGRTSAAEDDSGDEQRHPQEIELEQEQHETGLAVPRRPRRDHGRGRQGHQDESAPGGSTTRDNCPLHVIRLGSAARWRITSTS